MISQNKFSLVPRSTTFLRALKFVKNPIPSLNEFQAKYGDSYSMYMGGMIKGTITVDPEIIQTVLQKQHRIFEKSELQTKKMGYYLGRGLLTNTGNDWLKQRRLIQPGFHRDRLEHLIQLMLAVIRSHAEQLQSQSEEGTINISRNMLELSFQIIAKTLFSEHIPKKELDELSWKISTVQEFVIKQIRLPFLEPWFAIKGDIKKHKKMVDEMRSQLFGYIEQRRKKRGNTADLLDMLLDARYEDNGKAMSDEQLMDEILILFAAGHETTANALSWIWYLLSKHSWAVEKIRKESKTFFEQPISLNSLRELKFTTRVIQEAMRMYPPAWITDRVALSNTEIAGNKLSKNEMVVIYIYGVHHNPKYWNSPEEFNPDRFLPENANSRPAFAYLPFGGGPRLCIGNSFSMMEMQLTVAYFIQNFDFKLVNDRKIEMQPLITLRPKTPIEMSWRKSN